MAFGNNPLTGRPGPTPHPPRDGDKVQARQRINVEVRTGRRPHPSALACVDCQHVGDDRRHEYDHYRGYAAQHHADVEPVCSVCHRRRSRERGEIDPAKLVRAAAAVRAAGRKTHCKVGHPMARFPDGKWRCHECRKAYYRARNARLSAGRLLDGVQHDGYPEPAHA